MNNADKIREFLMKQKQEIQGDHASWCVCKDCRRKPALLKTIKLTESFLNSCELGQLDEAINDAVEALE